jgi:hypothetical protein
MCCFQRRDGLLTRHRRKRIEEFVEAVIAFEVIDQIPKGHTRPNEHRGWCDPEPPRLKRRR